jgi:hypothetical protein
MAKVEHVSNAKTENEGNNGLESNSCCKVNDYVQVGQKRDDQAIYRTCEQ